MPPVTQLPPVNARVDIWFDGYDEYYPGRVDSITGTHEFHVVLDDGTDWDIDTRKHVFKLSEPAADSDHPQIPETPDPTPDPVLKDSDKPLSADVPSPPPRRRASGRALRKSATSRPDYDYEPESPSSVRRSMRVEAAAAASRVTRPRRGVEEAPPPTPPDRAQRAVRRTRQRDVEEEEANVPVPKKPRRQEEIINRPKERSIQRVKDAEREKQKAREKEREREKQREAEMEREKESEQQREIITRVRNEYGLEGLSTKAVTAIAVDAALQSAKAVLSPVNERLEGLVKEVVEIGKIAMRATEAAESRKREHAPPSAITAAALENFQLDASEIIGGGEARLKAYSGMSEQEFEALHRVIDAQGKALKEIDRLLYAAQEFGKRAKENAKKPDQPKEQEPDGKVMEVDKSVVENTHPVPLNVPKVATAQ